MERGEDLRELYEIRSSVEATAARLAARRRTEAQLSEIDAHGRRIEAAAAEPIALHAGDADAFDAAMRSLVDLEGRRAVADDRGREERP